jgi:predicted site-specific integrase-resolvase
MCKGLSMTEPQLLGSTETCERLGISRSTLTQWMDKGWIVPAEQLAGGAYVFTGTEVERAKAERATQAAAS